MHGAVGRRAKFSERTKHAAAVVYEHTRAVVHTQEKIKLEPIFVMTLSSEAAIPAWECPSVKRKMHVLSKNGYGQNNITDTLCLWVALDVYRGVKWMEVDGIWMELVFERGSHIEHDNGVTSRLNKKYFQRT